MKKLKILAQAVKGYWLYAILTPIFVTMEVVMEINIPLLAKKLVDEGVYAQDINAIWTTGIQLVVCAVVMFFFGGFSGRFCSVASTGFAKNLRERMFSNIQGFSFSNIDKFSQSSLITRMTTDTTNVQNAFMVITRMAIRSPMMLIFSFVAAFSISHKLSLVFLCVVPVLGLGMFFIVKSAFPLFKRVFKTYDSLNEVVSEDLHGIRVVKSYVREEHEKSKFNKISDKIYKDFSRAEKTVNLNNPLMQFCIYSLTLVIMWFGAKEIVASGNNPDIGLSTGGLMSLMIYIIQILMSLMMLSFALVQLTLSKASADRICEILAEKSDIVNPASPVCEVRDGSICFNDVSFAYSRNASKLCLDNVNLNIKSGETVGIIGGTGSSKSTLVQLIPRLYDATAGEVLVGGIDVKKYDIETLRNSVSMVLQKNVLFSGTIKENLRWGDENATDEEIKHACELACADEFISGFENGYDTYIEQGGTNVSGGQKQRLCIARALLKKPKILILDDSTSAVDTRTDAKIRAAMKSEIPDTTKLIIAQRITSVMDADRTVVLDDGKVVDFGTHDELMARCDIYREVYESQMKGGEKDA